MTDHPGSDEFKTADLNLDNSDRPFSLTRTIKPILMILVLGFAVHILLPQLDQLQRGLEALRSGRWPFLLITVACGGLVFVAGAFTVRSSTSSPPNWLPAITTQAAASFASAITPGGLGWIAVTRSSLQKAGTGHDEAAAATGLNMLITATSHVALIIVMTPFLPTLNFPSIPAPSGRVAVDLTAVAAVAIGVFVWVLRSRRHLFDPVLAILRQVPGVLRDPRRSGAMALGAVAQNVAYTLALLAALAAFGVSVPPIGLLVVYMVSATVASISPTPGGLGAMEAALVAGITRLGIPGGEAVAAVLSFRVATFWLPLPVGAWLLRVARHREWA